jgi:hypothetical protein
LTTHVASRRNRLRRRSESSGRTLDLTTSRTRISKEIKRSVSSARRTASNPAGDAAAVGVDVAQPAARDDLLAALAPAKGSRVVDIRTDRRQATDLHQRLAEAVRSSRGT